MQKNLAIRLWLVFTVLVYAIPSSAQVQFAVKAGAGVSNLKFDFDRDFPTSWAPAFATGVEVTRQFRKSTHWFVGGGLQIAQRRYHYTQARGDIEHAADGTLLMPDDTAYYAEIKSASFWYVQAPVFISFRTKHVYLSAGPYLGVAFAGTKISGWARSRQSEVSLPIEFGKEGTGSMQRFRRLDYGIRSEFGGIFLKSALQAGIYYEYGMANALPDLMGTEESYAARFHSFGIVLNYIFKTSVLKY